MKKYRCPVCKKPLTKKEYEQALQIHTARQEHLHTLERELARKERNLSNAISNAKKNAVNKERMRTNRLMQGWKGKVKTLEERIHQLEKGTTPQTDGLEFEGKLVSRLRKEFPDDGIQHKGKAGDVLQIVRFDKKDAGVIIYECKRTPKILKSHIRQTNLAKQSREAEFAVLVTTGQKRGFSGLATIDGVLVVSPLGSIPLARLLRTHLIEMLRMKITKQKRAKIAQELMKHITSPQFKNPIEEVITISAELQAMIKQEARDHIRVWRKRWDHYETIKWDSSQVQDNIRLVLHGKAPRTIGKPKVSPLQLPSPTD